MAACCTRMHRKIEKGTSIVGVPWQNPWWLGLSTWQTGDEFGASIKKSSTKKLTTAMKMRRMFCALEDRHYVSAFVVGYSQNQCWSSMSFLWPQTSSSQNFTSDSFVSLTNISQPLAKRGFNPFCLNAGMLSQQCLSYRTCSMWRFEILSQVQAFWTSMIQQNSSHLSCLFVHFSAAKRVTILFGGCVTANLGVVTDWWLPVLQVLPKLPGNLVNSKGFVDVSGISRY